MLADSKVLFVQFPHLAHHVIHQCLAEGNQIRCLIRQVLQFEGNLGLQIEDRTLQGDHIGGRSALVHAKELKVAAEVKNIELVLILTIHQPRTQTGATPNHLPELRFAHDLFKEHQIQHLRHVDAGVQHTHGNGDLRQLFRIGELVNRALGVSHIVINDLGKAGQMGVFFIEYLQYFFGMGVVLCEDDCLSQLVTVVDFDALGHQGIQHFADRIFVKNPLVQCR